ncbi:unnamed protein product [Didymodactylos carnosus]|uniref:Uncharacterized protein n=1 Tax=Didymodactylos carnosus TaxID=1234261 RepID=A0A814MGE0_9BILA|nr:unnamed protein product [Didymodactylos carnosus]CAF1078132.1 unnamed protein product [Didymodactylos carnosus]CAF3650917.1 unnamed protein product [Didymodactylos carnosus]CAF3844360.1 unnamed protein product [Didymodactylos carnosus]
MAALDETTPRSFFEHARQHEIIFKKADEFVVNDIERNLFDSTTGTATNAANPSKQTTFRRSSKKISQMLQQILQRGELQVEPSWVHKYLGQLHYKRLVRQKNYGI